MLESAAVLSWSAGATNITLGAGFVWATALLIGIVAIIRNHIRGVTRVPRPMPLTRAAGELRLLLVYTGLGWGLGAFLILPPSAVWAVLVFAAAPWLTAAFLLKCEKAVIAFALPASLMSASALFWSGQPQAAWTAGAILIAGVSILSMLQCAMRARQDLH